MVDRAAARLSAGPATRELRSFALSVGAVLAALGVLAYWRGGLRAGAVLGGVGTALMAVGLVAPGRLGGVHRAWMALALAISKVTTPVFMGIVYFGVLTPIGLAMRLVRRRWLGPPRGAPTYWIERPPGSRRSDLRRQF